MLNLNKLHVCHRLVSLVGKLKSLVIIVFYSNTLACQATLKFEKNKVYVYVCMLSNR